MNFSIVPNWIIRDSDWTAREILVYIALLNRANKTGWCWPSMKTLASESRSDERTVRATIKRLESRGILEVTRRPQEHGRHLPNLYHVAVWDRTSVSAPDPSVDPSPDPSGGGVHKRTPLGGNSAPEWGAQMSEEVHPLEEDPEEVDVRSASAKQTRNLSFPDDRATEKQLTYLRDLWIHHTSEAPADDVAHGWAQLSRQEAVTLTQRWLASVPRYDEYQGPEPGEPSYEALSPVGQQFAYQLMLPE